jgi:hypothetical protein
MLGGSSFTLLPQWGQKNAKTSSIPDDACGAPQCRQITVAPVFRRRSSRFPARLASEAIERCIVKNRKLAAINLK